MKQKILLSLACVFILSSCNSQKPSVIPEIHMSPITGEDFSIVLLPDTQNEVQKFPHVFMSQINWIIEKQKELNIQAVVHL